MYYAATETCLTINDQHIVVSMQTRLFVSGSMAFIIG